MLAKINIERNWFLSHKLKCSNPIPLQPDGEILKFWNWTEFMVLNIYGLRHWVAKV